MASPLVPGVVLACSLVLAASARASVQETPPVPPAAGPDAAAKAPDAESFDKEFAAASKLSRQRRWKEAATSWNALLRRHAGAPYVRPRLVEIREHVKNCAFWQVTRDPKPSELVSGELLSYDSMHGRVRLRYTATSLADFESPPEEPEEIVHDTPLGKLAIPNIQPDRVPSGVHPMRFAGPYTIEITGSGLSAGAFLFELEGERGYALRLGWRGEEKFTFHELLELGGREPKVIESAEPVVRKQTGPVKVSISVDSREIVVKYDKKVLFTLRRTASTFGQIGLVSEILRKPGWFDELTVMGTIEPSWIDGLIDARAQDERLAFEAKYVEPPELAAWGSARPSESTSAALQRLLGKVEFPGLYTPEQAQRIEELSKLRSSGNARDALAALLALTEDEIPARARELMITFCEFELDRPRRALAHLEAHAKLVEPTLPLRYLRAHLAGRVERLDEAIEMLRELATSDPREPLFHVELARQLLVTARYDEARAALARGIELSGTSEDLLLLQEQLGKATVGPAWRRGYPHTSKRFVVESDLDAELSRKITRELDEAWKNCSRWLGRPEPPVTGPTRAFVFSGEPGYLAYIQGIADPGIENTAGIYSRSLDQIVAWNQPRYDELEEVLRHECMHRYLDLALGDLPRWLNEGLAEAFCVAKQEDGRWVDDAIHREHAEFLKTNKSHCSAVDLMRENDEQFLSSTQAHYAQSWALVHFLRFGKDPAATRFYERLWTALEGKTDAGSAVESALAGLDPGAFERAYMAHWRMLVAAK